MTHEEHKLEELWDALCVDLDILESPEKQDYIREYGKRLIAYHEAEKQRKAQLA
jgi:hypothetical protein